MVHVFLFECIHFGKSFFKEHSDVLTGSSIDEHNPLVDQELLGFKLDLNSLEHLDSTDDKRVLVLGDLLFVNLVEHQILLEGSFDFGGKFDATGDQRAALGKEVRAGGDVLTIFEIV